MLKSKDGQTVKIKDILYHDRNLLVFWSPGCGASVRQKKQGKGKKTEH